MNTGIILLAAGESARFGDRKQLLPWHGGTLLRHMADVALDSGLGPVTVVLGAAEKECKAALAGLPLSTVTNAGWQEGMGGSVAAGMLSFREHDLQSVVVMLCDQPGVTPGNLRALRDHLQNTGSEIVASEYSGTLGPPAIFAAPLFPKLSQLRGHTGAKSLFHGSAALASLPLPEAAFDIDTTADLAAFSQWGETQGVNLQP